MKEEYWLAKVHFIAGKGGVGKSLICQALTKFFAQQGLKTLLVCLSEDQSGQPNDSIAPIIMKDKNSYEVCVNPDQALNEYLALKIEQKAMLGSFLNNNLFRRLCEVLPGLADLTRLGKICYHQDNFDKIVVDMPSSGFVARFLSVAKTVESAVKIGPLAREAALLNNYFSQKNNACVHLVALPKELVVNETIELYNNLQKNSPVHLGLLFVNRILDLAESDLSNLKQELKSGFTELKKINNFFAARLQDEQAQILRLKQKTTKIARIELKEFFEEPTYEIIIDEIVSKLVWASTHV